MLRNTLRLMRRITRSISACHGKSRFANFPCSICFSKFGGRVKSSSTGQRYSISNSASLYGESVSINGSYTASTSFNAFGFCSAGQDSKMAEHERGDQVDHEHIQVK